MRDGAGQVEGLLLTSSQSSTMGLGMEDAPGEWELDALSCASALHDAEDPEWAAVAAQVWNAMHCTKETAPHTCSTSVLALEAIAERLAVRTGASLTRSTPM